MPSLWSQLGFEDGPEVLAWLPWARPKNETDLWDLFEKLQRNRGFIIYAIVGDPDRVNSHGDAKSSPSRQEALGTIGYLEVNLNNRTIESGAVLFGTALKRSAAATEAHYLLLRNICEPKDSPPYRRIAWVKQPKLEVFL
jgi:RimJ/RimL family protein N-acetyltransferase